MLNDNDSWLAHNVVFGSAKHWFINLSIEECGVSDVCYLSWDFSEYHTYIKYFIGIKFSKSLRKVKTHFKTLFFRPFSVFPGSRSVLIIIKESNWIYLQRKSGEWWRFLAFLRAIKNKIVLSWMLSCNLL